MSILENNAKEARNGSRIREIYCFGTLHEESSYILRARSGIFLVRVSDSIIIIIPFFLNRKRDEENFLDDAIRTSLSRFLSPSTLSFSRHFFSILSREKKKYHEKKTTKMNQAKY